MAIDGEGFAVSGDFFMMQLHHHRDANATSWIIQSRSSQAPKCASTCFTTSLLGRVDLGRLNRRMPKVLLHHLQRHPFGEGVTRVGVAEPMGARLCEPPRADRVTLPRQRPRARCKARNHLIVERRRGNACVGIKAPCPRPCCVQACRPLVSKNAINANLNE